MSYDLMVFRKEAAPKNKIDFMKWYLQQTEWTENHSYDDPANTSTELKNWFMEMIKTFPPMNGPLALSDEVIDNMDDDSYITDYAIGKDVIYCAFAWSLAEEAYKKMFATAQEYEVGFFDASGSDGEIYFPENGKLILCKE